MPKIVALLALPFSAIVESMPEALKEYTDWYGELSDGPFTFGDTDHVLVRGTVFTTWMWDVIKSCYPHQKIQSTVTEFMNELHDSLYSADTDIYVDIAT